ncbi:unnamed protein product [Cylindrotheca closterium]|uniref:DUF6824 domain-containing protein n=1 Tax=Cylindrotheca closterium TaxID=2856 RepID=A0AAD2JM47_9STRA|nr:unnamed protein product [Cylindrotheca closterium]
MHTDNTASRIETHWCESMSEPFPETFKPGKWDVLCCGGKEAADHAGNRRYRVYIAKNIAAYSEAKCRWEKSMIVDSIIELVRRGSKSHCGGFVKKDTSSDRWYPVGNKPAREKVSHALRDAIKAQRKREERMRRHLATLLQRAKRLPQVIQSDYTMSEATLLSSSAHRNKDQGDDFPVGAIVSDDEDDDTLFSHEGEIAFYHDNNEWEKSLQASTESFLKSGESSEICFGLPIYTG